MRILIVGSLTVDIIGCEERPGGPALFCSLAARFLGGDYLCVGLIPRRYRWAKPRGYFIESEGPIFEHAYFGDRRVSRLVSLPRILDELPVSDRFDVALISPVYHEFSDKLLDAIRAEILIADVQGFVRTCDPRGNIILREPEPWEEEFLRRCAIIHASIEEARYVEEVSGPAKIITMGSDGSIIVAGGEEVRVPAFRVEGDPTGAGDFFTTVLAMKYYETRDILQATIFASAATSVFIEKRSRIGDLAGIKEELAMRIRTIERMLQR